MQDHCHLNRRLVREEALIVLDLALAAAGAEGVARAAAGTHAERSSDLAWVMTVLTQGGRYSG